MASFDPMEESKANAWKSEAGKSEHEAMKEYIDIISENYPGWQFSAAMNTMKDKKNAHRKHIVWAFKCTMNEDLSKLSGMHLLRFDTETHGINWFDSNEDDGSQIENVDQDS